MAGGVFVIDRQHIFTTPPQGGVFVRRTMKEISHGMIETEHSVRIYNLSENKATLNMAKKMASHLSGRFSIVPTGRAMSYNAREFAEISGSSETIFASFSSTGNGRVRDKQALSLIAGTCLFGADGLRGIDSNGFLFSLTDPFENQPSAPIEDIEEMVFPHPSEIESILRTTTAISILRDNDRYPSDDVLYFHLPIPEYLMYIRDYVHTGALYPEVALSLISTIYNRGHGVANMVARRIPANITPIFTSPLESAAEALVASRFSISLSEMVNGLSQSDPLMAHLLDMHPPTCFSDINYLSYTHLYIAAQSEATELGRSCVAVEEAKEGRILTEAKKQAFDLGLDFSIGAIYLAPKMISKNGLHGKSDLFMHDTTRDSILQQLKSVVNIYRR